MTSGLACLLSGSALSFIFAPNYCYQQASFAAGIDLKSWPYQVGNRDSDAPDTGDPGSSLAGCTADSGGLGIAIAHCSWATSNSSSWAVNSSTGEDRNHSRISIANTVTRHIFELGRSC